MSPPISPLALFLAVTLAAAACGNPSRPQRPSTSEPTAVARPATSSSNVPTTKTPARVITEAPPTTTTTTAARRPAAATCAPNLAGRLASTRRADQLVTVEARAYRTTFATLTLWQRNGSCWVAASAPWPARIAAGGFSDHHIEGDETTPTGAYGIGPVMYGNAPDPGVRYSYHALTCGDWWDEDPSSSHYNTFQHVACGRTPAFGGDSEALWQNGSAYPSFAVLDYNIGAVVAGAGSAIFIHADTGGPTIGCVSLPLAELDALLRWLRPTSSPLVVMGPDGEIDRY